MHHNVKDMAGLRFGRLVVLAQVANSGDGAAKWLCLCDCGARTEVVGRNLRHGGTRSCGCFAEERRCTHKGCGTVEYSAWKGMWKRCTNPNSKDWERYGGRGIYVCERWRNYALFLADVGHKPRGKYSLDRRENNGNYEPGNVRWATDVEQARTRIVDLTGQRFGRLVALEPVHGMCGVPMRWQCRCDCGKSVKVVTYNLRKGVTRSCGCLQRELLARRNKMQKCGGKRG